MSGGSGWIADPLVRSENGWDGDPVLWLGRTGMGSTAFDQDEEEPWPEPEPGNLGVSRPLIVPIPEGASEEEARALVDAFMKREEDAAQAEWDSTEVRAVRGAAAKCVAAIEVEQDGRTWTVPARGAVVGAGEADGRATTVSIRTA